MENYTKTLENQDSNFLQETLAWLIIAGDN